MSKYYLTVEASQWFEVLEFAEGMTEEEIEEELRDMAFNHISYSYGKVEELGEDYKKLL